MKSFLLFSRALVTWPPKKQFFTHNSCFRVAFLPYVMRGDLWYEICVKKTWKPILKYPKYPNIRIFEKSLANDLELVCPPIIGCVYKIGLLLKLITSCNNLSTMTFYATHNSIYLPFTFWLANFKFASLMSTIVIQLSAKVVSWEISLIYRATPGSLSMQQHFGLRSPGNPSYHFVLRLYLSIYNILHSQ